LRGEKACFRAQRVERKKNKLVVTLGRYLGMEAVGIFSLRGLVGRFGYWALGVKDVHNWVEGNWGPLLGYSSETFILMKGWFCFFFRNSEDAEKMLQKV
jgi:hypothetical protein